jgi:hypothetical protein
MINNYYVRISPGVIKGDIFYSGYRDAPYVIPPVIDPCCPTTDTGTTVVTTGSTGYYKPLYEVLSGGTNGISLLEDLSIPIFLSENTIDLGYYTPTDGYLLQKDVVNNFLFTANTANPYQYYVYNTSDIQKLAYLNGTNYFIDWGDNTVVESFNDFLPNYRSHLYTQDDTFEISVSAITIFGTTIVKKKITTPYSAVTISNPNGIEYFVSNNGSWSATPISVEYIYDFDSNNSASYQATSNFVSVPYTVTGYTESTINDLQQYGPSKFPPPGIQVTGSTGNVGTYYGPDPTNTYVAYTINGVDFYDYQDFTLFAIQSSGITENDLSVEPLIKDETLLNVVMEPEVQSNVYVERGKISALESIQRLGEVNSVGDIETYGYGFFNVVNIK